jgi:cobalt/nickel transport system ATP-binding protein
MPAAIEVRNLRYRYDDGSVAVDGIDFVLESGETVALLGPNGSGKTTFVLQLNGLLRGEGEVRICGVKLDEKTLSQARGRVGLVFQDSDEQLFMPTVLEDVAFGPRNQGMTPEAALQKAHECLDQVGMAEMAHKAPYHLSAGEKRRVALAGVLAMSPEILVLDEPTTYLDPPGQRQLLTLLRRLPQSKLIVTHDILFARAIAQRAVFFQKGKLIAQGSVDELAARFRWDSSVLD